MEEMHSLRLISQCLALSKCVTIISGMALSRVVLWGSPMACLNSTCGMVAMPVSQD